MRLLLVEDDPTLGPQVQTALQNAPFAVVEVWCSSGRTGRSPHSSCRT